jgi:class 3 adenylate cyclase
VLSKHPRLESDAEDSSGCGYPGDSHHALVRQQLVRFRGREIDTAGDGFFASFDGPARAVRCACTIVETVPELGLDVRAGLHTGECELIDGKPGGLAVVVGARISSSAPPARFSPPARSRISSPARGSCSRIGASMS